MNAAQTHALRELAQDRIGRENLRYADLQALRAGRFEEVAGHLERRTRILLWVGTAELLLFLGVAGIALLAVTGNESGALPLAAWLRGALVAFLLVAVVTKVAILAQNSTILRAHASLLRSLADLAK